MLSNCEEPFEYMTRSQRSISKLCIDLGIDNPYYRITPKKIDIRYSLEGPISEVEFGCEIPDSHLNPEVLVKFLRGIADIIEEENKNGTN